MHDERRTFEGRLAKEHRLPEIVHPRQMSRPIHVRDFVQNRPEEGVVSDAIIKHLHETSHVATIGDIEPRLVQVRLVSCPRPLQSSINRGGVSLRSSKPRRLWQRNDVLPRQEDD